MLKRVKSRNQCYSAFYYSVLFVLFPLILVAQQDVPDSLLRVIRQTQNDSLRWEEQLNLSKWYIYNDKVEAGIQLATKVKKISPHKAQIARTEGLLGLGNYYLGKYTQSATHFSTSAEHHRILKDSVEWAYELYRLGNVFRRLGNTDKAVEVHHTSLNIRRQIVDSSGIGSSLMAIGILHYKQGNYKKAEEYYAQALDIFEAVNSAVGVSYVAHNLSLVYKRQGAYNKAVQALIRSLKIDREQNDRRGMAITLGQIGNIYDDQDLFQKALNFYKKSLEIKKEIADSAGMASMYNNIGGVYLSLGETKDAKEVLLKAQSIKEKHIMKEALPPTYRLLGDVFKQDGNYEEANALYQKAFLISKEINDQSGQNKAIARLAFLIAETDNLDFNIPFEIESGLKDALSWAQKENDLQSQQKLHAALSKWYHDNQQFQDALLHEQSKNRIKDSILNIEVIENIQDLQLKYETEQKARKIAEIQLDLQDKTQKNTVLLGSLGFIAAIAVFIFIFYRQKQALSRKEIEKLEKEKEIQDINTLMKGQEIERKRLASDLHDSLGSLLSMVRMRFTNMKQNFKVGKGNTDFNKTQELLDGACEQLRQISHNLMPDSLNKMGLTEGIKEYVKEWNVAHDPDVQFQLIDEVPELDEDREVLIFRIVQELIHNAMKHANADKILVQISNYKGTIHLVVEDNGKGFQIEKVEKGIGLSSIKARAKLLDAEFSIESDESGSTFYLDIPV